MKRHLQLRHPFVTQRFDANSWAIRVQIESTAVAPLCCELMMLLFEKAEKLSLLFGHNHKLILAVTSEMSHATGDNEKAIPINLSRIDFEFLLGFLLSWYRDGIAEVNHVDIELRSDNASGNDCTLVIEAEISRPPMPSEEVERILKNM